MKQSDLNRAVARATGESVRLIKSLGFSAIIRPCSSPRRRVQRVSRKSS
jgi:hypothetical protein